MSRRRVWVCVALGLVAITVFVVVRHGRTTPHARAQLCSVTVDGRYVELDLEQARYASLIAAIGTKRHLPARASSIAIATAYQESKVHNVDYGDRDSLGLFQQRPSQGWGSKSQIMNPHYSIGAFFDKLVHVDGYRAMQITKAAQRVQRSADGGAYAQHEPSARAIASALTGNSEAAFSCQVRTPARGSASPATVREDITKAFGVLPHTAGASENTIDYHVSNRRTAWALAQYAVANAERLGLKAVSHDGRRWTAKNSPKGWTKAKASAKRVRLVLS